MVPLEFPTQGKDFAPAIHGAKVFGSNGGVRVGLGTYAHEGEDLAGTWGGL